jgi:multiple sugar transport system ATP-binding protein
MAQISLKGVRKEFGQTVAVKDVNVDIKDGEFLVFVGPSGCGKTTTLRMIAGLESLTDGEITIGGRIVNEMSPGERDVAMVFQNYALYSHMTVRNNLGFALKARRLLTPGEIKRRVERVAEMLDLSELLDRKPRQLSGGQRQRVALGRAIVRDPQAFLMDEPLSNLDALLRLQTRKELVELTRELNSTVVYVTHDQVEAMTMGHRLAVMYDGEVVQLDTPEAIYRRPTNQFVAQFIGSPPMNFLTVTVCESRSKLILKGDHFQCSAPDNLEIPVGQSVTLGIRPDDLDLVARGGFAATVSVVEMLGSEKLVYANAGDDSLSLLVPSSATVKNGEQVKLKANPKNIHLFDPTTQSRITVPPESPASF